MNTRLRFNLCSAIYAVHFYLNWFNFFSYVFFRFFFLTLSIGVSWLMRVIWTVFYYYFFFFSLSNQELFWFCAPLARNMLTDLANTNSTVQRVMPKIELYCKSTLSAPVCVSVCFVSLFGVIWSTMKRWIKRHFQLPPKYC